MKELVKLVSIEEAKKIISIVSDEVEIMPVGQTVKFMGHETQIINGDPDNIHFASKTFTEEETTELLKEFGLSVNEYLELWILVAQENADDVCVKAELQIVEAFLAARQENQASETEDTEEHTSTEKTNAEISDEERLAGFATWYYKQFGGNLEIIASYLIKEVFKSHIIFINEETADRWWKIIGLIDEQQNFNGQLLKKVMTMAEAAFASIRNNFEKYYKAAVEITDEGNNDDTTTDTVNNEAQLEDSAPSPLKVEEVAVAEEKTGDNAVDDATPEIVDEGEVVLINDITEESLGLTRRPEKAGMVFLIDGKKGTLKNLLSRKEASLLSLFKDSAEYRLMKLVNAATKAFSDLDIQIYDFKSSRENIIEAADKLVFYDKLNIAVNENKFDKAQLGYLNFNFETEVRNYNYYLKNMPKREEIETRLIAFEKAQKELQTFEKQHPKLIKLISERGFYEPHDHHDNIAFLKDCDPDSMPSKFNIRDWNLVHDQDIIDQAKNLDFKIVDKYTQYRAEYTSDLITK